MKEIRENKGQAYVRNMGGCVYMVQGSQQEEVQGGITTRRRNNKGTRLDFKGTQGRMDLVPLQHSGQMLGLLRSLGFKCHGKMTSWDLSVHSGGVLRDITTGHKS